MSPTSPALAELLPPAGSVGLDPAPDVDDPHEVAPADPPVRRIRPARGWRMIDLAELWQYRELLFFLVWRDVKVRYRQTALGAVWAVLQPVLMVVVFTIFFGRLAGLPSAGVPYPLFVLTGLLPWMFFAAAVAAAGNSVVASERLVTKTYFPRLAVPLAAVGVAAVDFAVASGVLVAVMTWYGAWPGAGFLLALPIAAVIGLAAFGFGSGLAALTVRYRDFRHVLPFMVQFWMFATPAVYMHLPEDGGGVAPALVWANPMVALVGSFRAVCLGLPVPWPQLGVAVAVVLTVAALGTAYFRKVEDDFADII